jgi:hypothetical protein
VQKRKRIHFYFPFKTSEWGELGENLWLIAVTRPTSGSMMITFDLGQGPPRLGRVSCSYPFQIVDCRLSIANVKKTGRFCKDKKRVARRGTRDGGMEDGGMEDGGRGTRPVDEMGIVLPLPLPVQARHTRQRYKLQWSLATGGRNQKRPRLKGNQGLLARDSSISSTYLSNYREIVDFVAAGSSNPP